MNGLKVYVTLVAISLAGMGIIALGGYVGVFIVIGFFFFVAYAIE